jgi:hypothetical protein
MTGRLPYAEEEDEVPGLVGAAPPLVPSPPTPRAPAPTTQATAPEAPEASPHTVPTSAKPSPTPPSASPVAEAQRRLLIEAVRGGPLGTDEDPMLVAMAAISLLRGIPFAAAQQDGSGAWSIPLPPEVARDLRSFTAAPPRRRA